MRLLVLGANSDIAKATCARVAARGGVELLLASRDLGELRRVAADLELRHGGRAEALAFDALDTASHRAFYEAIQPPPDVVLLAFGELGDARRAETDFAEARRILEVNYLGAVSILEVVAADFAARRAGRIVALSSVAGERGRASNTHYGAAKAALTTFLSGLRQRLAPRGVSVITVLPGPVRTKMTAGRELPRLLTATPERVARDVVRALTGRRDVVFTPAYWRWVMRAVRWLPEPLFKRLHL